MLLKYTISFLALCFIGLSAFSQEDVENSYILVCKGNQPKFSLDELRNCNNISIRDDEYAVQTFQLVVMKKSKRTELILEGNELTEEAFELIEKQKDPRTIRIEKVMDTDGTPVEGFRELIITD